MESRPWLAGQAADPTAQVIGEPGDLLVGDVRLGEGRVHAEPLRQLQMPTVMGKKPAAGG